MLLLWLIALVLEVTAHRESYVTNIRKRVELQRVRFQRGFKYQKLCEKGIAMYSTGRGYWKCKSTRECPEGYACTENEDVNVCCPTENLCPEGCPLSNVTGILMCRTDKHCPSYGFCKRNGKSIGVCCMANIMCTYGLPQIEGFNPYPILRKCVLNQDCRDEFTCSSEYASEGICCPDRQQTHMTNTEVFRLKELIKQNEDKIKRRQSLKRDVTYLIPLVGTPILLIAIMCGFHIRDEMQRRKDQRRINAFIARRKKKARKMPSAEIREGDFKYQGVLKMHGEIGEIKHALDDASSRSLEGVGFDRKYNELVVIGSAVEHIEVSQETTDASIRDTKSKTSTMKTASAERIKNLAEKIKSSAEKVKSTAEDQKQKANSAQRDSSVKKSVKHEPDHQRILSPSRKGRSSTVIPLHPQRSPTQKSVGLRAKLAALKNSSSKSMEGSMKSVEDAKEVEVSFKSEPASESVMALSNSFSARTAQARSTSRTERSPQQEERRLSPSHRSDRTKQPPELTPLRFLTSSTASEPAIENSATTENVHRPPLPFGTRYVGRMVNPTNVRSESFDEIDAANAARSAPRSLSASPRPRSRWTSVSPRPRRFHSGGRRRTKK